MQPIVMPPSDVTFVRRIREQGILKDIDGHRLDENVILVSCGDARQFPKIFGHMKSVRESRWPNAASQVFAWNGGPLRLVHGGPANRRGRTTAEDCIDDIVNAREWLGINTVATVCHLACRHAAWTHLDAEAVIKLHHEAKLVLQKRDFIVPCFLHIQWPEEEARTYWIDRELWDPWIEENGSHRLWG